MKIATKRFGLPYNPSKEKKSKNKILRQIMLILVLFCAVALSFSFAFAAILRSYISSMSISDSIDSVWISSLGSYWGGIVGGVFSGLCAFLGVFFTIRYYKESDEQKERAAIQPFLLVTVGSIKNTSKGFSLGSAKTEHTEKIGITIKNIGNGFATTLVVLTGFNIGGFAFNHVIATGDSEELFFKANPAELNEGLDFAIQYIDAMRNEYVQEYSLRKENGHIEIECGYPGFLEQR